MESRHTNFYVYPSVIKVGVATKIKIVPRSVAKRFDNPFAETNWPPEDLSSHLKERSESFLLIISSIRQTTVLAENKLLPLIKTVFLQSRFVLIVNRNI